MRCFAPFATGLVLGGLLAGCPSEPPPEADPPPEDLAEHCAEEIGPPRVEKLSERIWVARGFDLANTILLKTSEGHVIVDVGLSPGRAQKAREALLAEVPGEVRAIIYTHSHADHTGGASAWVDEDEVDIWATEAFAPHLFKQYGLFRSAEARRAALQFGDGVDERALPCIGIGPRLDLEGALRTGLRLPTRTFSGRTELTVGDLELVLVEAPGETHDQLFVWLPEERALLPGDNTYAAFPNLYTIRGTSRRPVDEWIESLDAMRRLRPALLVPSHTSPVVGEEAVAERLRVYRDAIQIVRDHVVRGANAGRSLEEIAGTLALPPHLAAHPALQPWYGDPAWSAKGIYTANLGWFDGTPEALYPLPPDEAAALDVSLIGPERLLDEARSRLEAGHPAAALHLLAKLRLAGEEQADEVAALRARALRAQAADTRNTNGRAYLLRSARAAVEGEPVTPGRVRMDPELLDSIPLEVIFRVMATRLKPGAADDVHESVVFSFPDEGEQFVVTQRRGVAEVVRGDPLPGTPPPVATLRVPGKTYRRLALQTMSTAEAILAGDLDVEGSSVALMRFLGRFERGL